jgi:sorting nexin-7/30/sorting nexin-8
MAEDERAEKQAFLMAEIIEKNFDPDAFMAFCEGLKGADIDLWTFPELKKCVKEFQDRERPPVVMSKPVIVAAPTPAGNITSGNESSLTPTKTSDPKENEDLLKTYEVLPGVEEKKQEVEEKKQEVEVVREIPKEDKFTLSCRKFEPNALHSMTVTFEIMDAYLVKGGFFSSDYYLFPVKTLPINWEVGRRFSDFIWLREMLSTSITSCYIPPIPTRKSRQGTIENQLYKKKKIIARFTAGLSRNRFLLTSDLTERFFSIKDAKEFEDFKKRVKKSIKKPETIDQFITVDGNAHCDITFPGPRPEKLLDYASTAESIEKRLKRYATNVMNDIKTVESEFLVISELVNQLAELQNSLPNRENLKKLYSSLSECLKDVGGQEELRRQSFEEYFNIYFKYTYLEKEVMKEMLKERESAFNEYTNAELKKKNVDKFRNYYGFVNHRTLGEVERVIKENSMLMNQHFLRFAHEEVCMTTKLHELWTRFIENIEAI